MIGCAGAGVGPSTGAAVTDSETAGMTVVVIGLIFNQAVTEVGLGVLTVPSMLADCGRHA
jgi:hypothetical protein